MNESINIKDTLLKIIGDYQTTTPQAISVHLSGADSASSVSSYVNLQNGIASLDIVWIMSALLLIVGFIAVIGLVKAVLVAVVR